MSSTVGHFSIWGDFELDEITAALGLQPSFTICKDEVLDVDGQSHTSLTATWDYYCPDDSPVNEQVNFLLEKLWPRADSVEGLAERYSAAFNLAPVEGEVLNLNPEVLKRIAKLKVTVNCFCWKDESQDAD